MVAHSCNHCCQAMQYIPYLGGFAKLQKVTISFVMSVSLHGTTQLPLERFSWNLILEYFWKSVIKIQVSLKSDRNNRYLTWRPISICHSLLLLTTNVSDRSCRENHNTHFKFSNFFKKSCRLWDNEEKECTARQAGHRWQYGACTLHAGYLQLRAQTQNT